MNEKQTNKQLLRGRKVVFFLILLFTFSQTEAANRYWISGTASNWNNTANWSTASGGAGGAWVPTPGDTVIFDGLGVGNCIMDIPIDVAGIKIQATYSGVITQGANTILVRNIGFTQVGGSFVGGTAKIDLLGEFNLFGGTFTSTSDTLIVGHKSYALTSATIFTHSGGSFNHNNGIVKFSPEGFNANIFTVDVLTGDRFFDIEIDTRNANNSEVTSALGDTLYALNNIIHNDGEAEGYFALLGNLIINPKASGGGKVGYFIFLGTANQTWEYTGAVVPTSGFLINKTAGSVSSKLGTTDLYCTLLEIQQGTFNAPTGTLKIGHNFENGTNITVFKHSGGTFNHNNGLIWFSMTGYWANNFIVDVLPGDRFYDVKLDIANQDNVSLTVATGDTLYALNNLTHSDGLANGNYALEGNLIIDATAVGGNGWFIFLGTANQTYAYTTVPAVTNGILIAKPSGTVSQNPGTTDLYCSKIELRNGIFNAPTGSLKIGMGYQNSNTTVFKHTGGIFNHNNGLTWFAVTGYWANIFTVDVLPGDRFYDVKLDIANQDNVSLTVATGDTLYALNNLTHSDGLANGNYALEGNLIIDATAVGGNGWFIFLGTANQTYAYTTVPAVTNGILIAKPSGTVSQNPGTTDLYCSKIEIRNGTFNAPTGNLKIDFLWTVTTTVFLHSGGTFNHGNGTVWLRPAGYWYNNYNIDVLPSTQFYNLIIDPQNSNNYSKINIAAGDFLFVANNLTLATGQCNNSYIDVQGNVTIQSGYIAGATTYLIFSGSNNQTFDLTGAVALFDANVQINKTANNVSLLSACTLDAVGQSLTLTNGNIISTATNLLTLDDNVTVIGGSVNSFVSGPIKKIGNDAFTFPTGTVVTGEYAPITITAPVNITDAFTAEYFNVNPNSVPYSVTSKDPTLNHISQCEYWILNRTTGTSNVSVTLSWDTRSCGVTNLTDLKVARWDGAVWRDHGNGGITGTTASGTVITSTTVTSFSPFTLASKGVSNPLPIELLYFSAQWKDNKYKEVLLDWATASEINNDYFEVERSLDGIHFSSISHKQGVGNSSVTVYYNEIDNSPLGDKTSYYRLKQVDFNGSETYSNIEAINPPEGVSIVNLWPNPAEGEFSFIVTSTDADNLNVTIVDMAGKTIQRVSEPIIKGVSVIKINTQEIPVGYYFIRAETDAGYLDQKQFAVKK